MIRLVVILPSYETTCVHSFQVLMVEISNAAVIHLVYFTESMGRNSDAPIGWIGMHLANCTVS